MSNKPAIKKGRKQKRTIDPVKLAQLRQKRGTRSLFERMGFSRVASDTIEFKFEGRTGEIDDIFVQENVLLLVEYTAGKSGSGHIASKSILYDKILASSADWVESYSSLNPDFLDAVLSAGYQPREFQIVMVYVSIYGVNQEIESAFSQYRFLDGTKYRYFDALSKTIQKSARFEFYNYLSIDQRKLGERVHTRAVPSTSFHGHLLPEGHSGYPRGFKVVSFYADAETVLSQAYVLRKDGWRDSDGLYQRILIKSKIAKMRKYLAEVGRVFVNNIIVTLPAEAQILDPTTGKTLERSQLDDAAPVTVSLPLASNVVGLIDGQHRVFCYYENTLKDQFEKAISQQRKRQNLLVTGLKFPKDWDDRQRREFEAKLFLEINDNQAKAKSALKQSIEVILNPFSNTAIAKEITSRLARTGPLSGLLQTNFFDPPEKIKTTSIVTYGLVPLIKVIAIPDADSLFRVWDHPKKHELVGAKPEHRHLIPMLEEYLNFCVAELNRFLALTRVAVGSSRWKYDPTQKRQLLSPTTLNGFFVCLRRISATGKLPHTYTPNTAGLSAFPFLTYKSSGWRSMGDALFEQCFSPAASSEKQAA